MVPDDPELRQISHGASHTEIVNALNKLTTRFLEKCLADHLDTALSLESDDWVANCYMQRKVLYFYVDVIEAMHDDFSLLLICRPCMNLHLILLLFFR